MSEEQTSQTPGSGTPAALKPLPLDWEHALVIAAHPDDPEYGMAAAVAAWTAAGKRVSYLLVTRGEAGIAGLAPEQSALLRSEEQAAACAHVGVDTLEFLDYPDGRVEESLALRLDLARRIRRLRPDVVLTLNYRDTWGPLTTGGGGWNSADHRAVGRSVLDAVSDADNEWIFPQLTDEGLLRHRVRFVAMSSPNPTHAQPVDAAAIAAAVASLAAHDRYLAALSPDPVEEQARRQVSYVTGGNQVGFEVFGL